VSDAVLAHSSTQSAAGFWRLTGALSRRGHRALTVEAPSTPADTSIEYAELLAAQLPADLHRPVIAPHSGAFEKRVTSRKRVKGGFVSRGGWPGARDCDGGFEGGCRRSRSARGSHDCNIKVSESTWKPGSTSSAELHRPWNPLTDHKRRESPVWRQRSRRRGCCPSHHAW
jgi:hypothetical protein